MKIGLYFHKIILSDTKTYRDFDFRSEQITPPLHDFTRKFLSQNSQQVIDSEAFRSWYAELVGQDETNFFGRIHYGSFGFKSTIRDQRTNKKKFDRSETDIEEIPLYFQLWLPKSGPYGFMVMQSFAERSCVGLVHGAYQGLYNQNNSKTRMTMKKFMPAQSDLLMAKSVKRVTFVRRNFPRDQVEKLTGIVPGEVDVELSIAAKRRGTLGALRDLKERLTNRGGAHALSYDGIEFEQAYAEVKVGDGYRKVGLFSFTNNAGVVDVTPDVQIGADGHPTVSSMNKLVVQLIAEFETTLGSR